MRRIADTDDAESTGCDVCRGETVGKTETSGKTLSPSTNDDHIKSDDTLIKSTNEDAEFDGKFSFRFAMLSLLCASVAVILIAMHCYQLAHDHSFAHLHHLLQLIGYLTFLHALLVHRLYVGFGLPIRKAVHVVSHLLCLSLLFTGISFQAYAKNTEKTANGKYESNLYTLHSFLAIGALAVYLFQLCLGACVGFFKDLFHKYHTKIKQLHREIGLFLLTALTAVVTCGVQQLFYRKGCPSQGMSESDLNPAESYTALSQSCQMLNCIGLLVYAASLLAALALSTAKVGSIFSGTLSFEGI